MSMTGTDIRSASFQQLYNSLRSREKKLYADDLVAGLPDIAKNHPHYEEWKMRKLSCKRLLAYLQRKNMPCDILDIGCGNGWLTAKMAGITTGKVTGIDISNWETEQAKRVFGDICHLHFINGSLPDSIDSNSFFDTIVFAGVLSYFSSAKEIINKAMKHLKPRGEIHIMDTPFYKPEEVVIAKKRTRDYLAAMGLIEFADHYFHHSLADLRSFDHQILHKPTGRLHKLRGIQNPFYHIIIRKGIS